MITLIREFVGCVHRRSGGDAPYEHRKSKSSGSQVGFYPFIRFTSVDPDKIRPTHADGNHPSPRPQKHSHSDPFGMAGEERHHRPAEKYPPRGIIPDLSFRSRSPVPGGPPAQNRTGAPVPEALALTR
jgi:hypothetical protein